MPAPFAKERLLRQLWGDETLTNRQIAERLQISDSYLCKLRERLELPRRCPVQSRPPYDPTPEQIAERARECRERHLAELRAESDEASRSRSWRHRLTQQAPSGL